MAAQTNEPTTHQNGRIGPIKDQHINPNIECKEAQTCTIPKSHKKLIRNTLKSLSSEANGDIDDEKKAKCRKRMHKAGEILLLKNAEGALKTVGEGNYPKKTYCYKLITGDKVKYFVKIFEDSKIKPTKISKKLYSNKKLQCKMAPYLLIPAFKPNRTPLDAHTYDVVIYPYIQHANLQDITLKALRANFINPSYHTQKDKEPHGAGYKLRMLKRFEQCVSIAITMKDDGKGYVDMDVSPDNFIITTDIPNAADVDNEEVKWSQITDAKDAKLIKIDHESMMQWKEKFERVNKPMKASFRAPEVNRQKKEGIFDTFDVEKANVYQYGATFIYVLYGQLKHYDKDGDERWKSLPYRAYGDWVDTQWTPCCLDMEWLHNCVKYKPKDRPTYDELLSDIKRELDRFNWKNKDKFKPKNEFSFIKDSKAKPAPKKNNFYAPFGVNNNGAITIVHTQQTLMQRQKVNTFNNMRSQHRHTMNNFNDVSSQQRVIQQQQQLIHAQHQQQRKHQRQQQLNQNRFQQHTQRPKVQNKFGDERRQRVNSNNFNDKPLQFRNNLVNQKAPQFSNNFNVKKTRQPMNNFNDRKPRQSMNTFSNLTSVKRNHISQNTFGVADNNKRQKRVNRF